MSDTLTTLLTTAGGAYLGKFVGPAAEAMGKVAWERAQQLGAKATALLTAVGREPQPVEPKLLVPLVQAASLETDETLVDKWAALLANVADPLQRVSVQPGFAEVLRQLTPLDARVLQFVAHASQGQSSELRVHLYSLATRIQREVGEGNREPTTAFQVAVDNLLRLRLCDGRGVTRPAARSTNTLSDLLGGHADALAAGPGKDRLAVTAFGFAFLAAVTPPAQ